ncbi:MAG TPA: TRIC cation channel family protein [Micromonosporaceae bacterium]|jgi:uncharacterized membrane protein YeiH|nr:TRIC cation channel family protein [Micromonosporaceae bacterium]
MTSPEDLRLLAQAVTFGGWRWTGNETLIDLITTATNALNGALLARHLDRYKQFTVVGIILMAILGGLSGGVIRDVMLNAAPVALTNPAYLTVSVLAGSMGYRVAYARGARFRTGWLQVMTAFSLPWYAVAGAQKAADHGLPAAGILAVATVAATAGFYLIDLSSGVTPTHFVRSEWFVGTAVLTGAAWIACRAAGLGTWGAALLAVAVGFGFRLLATHRRWEEPLASRPTGST